MDFFSLVSLVKKESKLNSFFLSKFQVKKIKITSLQEQADADSSPNTIFTWNYDFLYWKFDKKSFLIYALFLTSETRDKIG